MKLLYEIIVHVAGDDYTHQMSGISIPDECAWCTRRVYKYIYTLLT